MTIAWILLALPAVLALYSYAMYPMLLWILARTRHPAETVRGDEMPYVTIVIPAYNEEAQIRGAIQSALSQEYPRDRRQILILSDASSDRTDDIVREYAGEGVELLRLTERSGKTAAENAAISRIQGTIVINTDASIRMHPQTMRRLVAALADPGVGVASTRDMSVAAIGEGANAAEAGYVGYEMMVRDLETRAGGIVGASGSGYAIRAELHRHAIRADLSRDFSAALTARRHGLRAVSVTDAVCYVPRTHSLRHEYRRKVRTISRGMDTLYYNRDLLNPARYGDFAWKLFSHKLCRWLVPLSALPAVIGLVLLVWHRALSPWFLLVAIVAAVGAVAGARVSDSHRLPRLLPAGVLGGLAANLAVVHAWWRFFHGHQDHVWEPTRRAPAR